MSVRQHYVISVRDQKDVRINNANIQMLSPKLHKQIFKNEILETDQKTLEKVQEHLQNQNLLDKEPSVTKNVDFLLPDLSGNTIEEHFFKIAKDQSRKYYAFAESLANVLLDIPRKPRSWIMKSGWTKYLKDGRKISVAEPDETSIVFDVEVCMNAGNLPVIAVAVSKNAW